MRIKMPAVRIAQDSETSDAADSYYDVLMCGSCQKTFALGEIVKFIQHKVLQCNKENYGQCYTQGANAGERDEDGRPQSLTNSRRPSISAPISQTRKASGSRVHTPPLSSPAELLGDGASSTPKRLLDDGKLAAPPQRQTTSVLDTHHVASGRFAGGDDTTTPIRRPDSSLGDAAKSNRDVEIKQERMETSSSHGEEEESPLGGSGKKKLRIEVVDAESNTLNSEPSNYVCSTCKARLSSAWRLVQHVQHAHNVKIYVEANGDRVSRPSSPSSHNGASGGGSRSSSKSNAGNGSSAGHQHNGTASDKNLSGSSSCSTSSSSPSGSLHQQLANKHINHQLPPQSLLPLQTHLQQQLQQQLAANQPQNQSTSNGNESSLAPPGMRHHPLLPPPEMHRNPFALLRMPMPPNSVVPGVGPLFPRSHDAQHQFRMEQLMSEQLRHHANLAAAAVAAANQLATPQGFTSPVSTGSNNERPPSSGSARNLSQNNDSTASQMDFYSQRLRQLAGTTSPGGAVTGNSTGSAVAAAAASPIPRKQPNSPFPGCSPTQTNPATPIQSSSRPQSLTPPDSKQSSHNDLSATNNGMAEDKTIISNPPPTPPSASTPPARPGAEGVHSCDFCEKKFRFQSSLIVHRRQHTGEKLFKCTHCDFCCVRAKKLKRHMKLHESPDDQKSNSGSDGDQMNDGDSDKEDDEDENEEGEEDSENEDEELDDEEEDEMDEDENEDDFNDEAEDLSVSSSKMGRHRPTSASLVGELMDKFGLSNIAQYSEAYKQALQESGNALKMHLTSNDRDNNNSAPPILGLQEKLNGMPGALRLREEFAKNLMQHHPNNMGSLGFNPFENPFDPSAKRMKMDVEGGWWGIPGLHRGSNLFDELKPKGSQGGGNHMMTSPLLKKESRRNDTCEYCGKVFKNCSNLTVHRRSHTGEKPYKCELCSYACAQSSKLTRHMKTHGRMGKDVYKCRFCDMPFSVPSTLEKHMRKCVVNQGRQLNNNNNSGNANHNLANGLAEQLSRNGLLGRHSSGDEQTHLPAMAAGMPPGVFGGVDMEELMAKQETA